MESVLGRTRERSAMQLSSHGGMATALLPWTRQILTVLWENFRLILQVICCSLMAVFQMFRFEVHLRITDDAGEHIQHMTNGHHDTEGFLLSSLFESNKNDVAAGQSSLSRFNKDPFNLNSHSRCVLSSHVNDNFCCSLVDNLVSCATDCHNSKEDMYMGQQYEWKRSFDWNFHAALDNTADEECVQCLYCSDAQKQCDCCVGLECNLSWLAAKGQSSDSEFSWGSSDSSSMDMEREDSDRLWDLLRCSKDPYHPLHFTACLSSAISRRTQSGSSQQRNEATSTPSSVSCCSDSTGQGNNESVTSEDEEEALWKSLSRDDDPYHPLNFRASFHSSHAFRDCREKSRQTDSECARTKKPKPLLMQRKITSHRCPQPCVETPVKVNWKRPVNKIVDGSMTKTKNVSTVKRVKFSPVIQIHKMKAWSFALQASRKGPWEEHARDRDRFQRRISETEQAIGYCFMPSHRDKFSVYH